MKNIKETLEEIDAGLDRISKGGPGSSGTKGPGTRGGGGEKEGTGTLEFFNNRILSENKKIKLNLSNNYNEAVKQIDGFKYITSNIFNDIKTLKDDFDLNDNIKSKLENVISSLDTSNDFANKASVKIMYGSKDFNSGLVNRYYKEAIKNYNIAFQNFKNIKI